MFVWMVKDCGFWTPVVFGWLPDKSETSYKVFFHFFLQKLRQMKINFNIKPVLCDSELNIMKSVDTMLNCEIHGCFFHHKKCFQRRIEKKGFKSQYHNNEHFQNFINQTSAMSHLPIQELETMEKFHFDDEQFSEFKTDHLQYLWDFSMNGVFPRRVWNAFGRSEDLTNNNQQQIIANLTEK